MNAENLYFYFVFQPYQGTFHFEQFRKTDIIVAYIDHMKFNMNLSLKKPILRTIQIYSCFFILQYSVLCPESVSPFN